jgi:hypothetical protein
MKKWKKLLIVSLVILGASTIHYFTASTTLEMNRVEYSDKTSYITVTDALLKDHPILQTALERSDKRFNNSHASVTENYLNVKEFPYVEQFTNSSSRDLIYDIQKMSGHGEDIFYLEHDEKYYRLKHYICFVFCPTYA